MEKICRLDFCDKAVRRGTLCGGHRTQRERGREFTPIGRYSDPESLFWSKVNKTDGCWNWTGYINDDGYGVVYQAKARSRAHRVAYEMEASAIPEGMMLDHICRNRKCVRPSHLRPVTNAENLQNRAGVPGHNTSGELGVSWNSRSKKWLGKVTKNGKHYHVGYFETVEEAAEAVRRKRLEVFTYNELDRAA